jgi:hypothetical protein
MELLGADDDVAASSSPKPHQMRAILTAHMKSYIMYNTAHHKLGLS